MLLKSLTQTNYFSQLIAEYQISKSATYTATDDMANTYDKTEFLNLIIQQAQNELGS